MSSSCIVSLLASTSLSCSCYVGFCRLTVVDRSELEKRLLVMYSMMLSLDLGKRDCALDKMAVLS